MTKTRDFRACFCRFTQKRGESQYGEKRYNTYGIFIGAVPMGLSKSAQSNHMSWPAPGKHKLQHPETEADRQQLVSLG